MTMFRKKPIVIEAVKYIGGKQNLADLARFCDSLLFLGDEVVIKTLKGVMTVSRGDWLIKGVAGEFRLCEPDIFEATYELVDDPRRVEDE